MSHISEQLTPLYLDIDNTILNTAEVFIKKYCEENNIQKDFYDLKDWKFRSIDRNIDVREFLHYIETEEFFNEVCIYDDFLRFFVKYGEDFDFIFVTIGTEKNCELKKKFLINSLPTIKNVRFICLQHDEDKNVVDMSNGIQVDDKYDNLNTNAKIKILQTNLIDTDYNYIKDKGIREDLYVMNDWKEIGESIEFFDKEIKNIL